MTKVRDRVQVDVDSVDVGSAATADALAAVSTSEYEVQAIVEHHGRSSTCGHYTALGRDGSAWRDLNDHRVKMLSPRDARPAASEGFLFVLAWDNAHEYTYSRLTDAGVMPLIQSAAGQLGTTSDSIVGLMLGAAVFLKGMGGLALAFGGEACGTVMLMLFLVPVTFFMHAPTHTGPGSLERNFDETSHLLKNGAIAGALLVLWQSIPAKDARSGGELAPRDSKKRR
ncbi:hypothetical protein FNF31_04986 [Cafeteria roenbergensis]|uniref:USP domain-containing protein n=1 Tax=Cafeteria roenbergensis TaxID=33653 RepID=A0A5A8D5A9_CAFRO|nr:hypothetical protein FNF31_04986 [Cafeteria roenbergensis]